MYPYKVRESTRYNKTREQYIPSEDDASRFEEVSATFYVRQAMQSSKECEESRKHVITAR